MTLTPFPASEGGFSATSPQPTWLWKFLKAEEDSTARLHGFFSEARLELEQFIQQGSLTASDATFYRQLLDETNRVTDGVRADGSAWASSVIPEAYSAGWRANSSVVVPRAALEALSRETLGLIVGASDDIRTSIRQSVAQGILQGLSGADLRARLLASGLTNIPHWPSVEYRAGVIARTETMRAFNAGVVSSIEATGARFVRWIISPDEAVCPICGPRSNAVFRLPGVEIGGPLDPYGPAVRALPKLPAHPRCRCTVRAEYRGPNGEIVKQGTPEIEPSLSADVMGGTSEPVQPLARGDLPGSTGRLMIDFDGYLKGRAFPDATRKFWREIDLDDDAIRFFSGLAGGTQTLARERVRALMFARYGVTFEGKWLPDGMASSLRALEAWRKIAPRYVVDSPYLTNWGSAPIGARRMTGTRSAEMYATCHMRPNFSSMATLAKRPDAYRIGIDDTNAYVLAHELAHSIHNRYGLHYLANTRFKPVEFPDGDVFEISAAVKKFRDGWAAIRTSAKVAPTGNAEQAHGAIRAARSALEEQERLVAAGDRWASPIRVTAAKKRLEAAEQALRDIQDPGGEYWPTDYARKGGYAEDFADSAALWLMNPARLKKYSPARYDFLSDLFGSRP